MARSADTTVLDALLDEIIDNGDEVHLCTQEPTTFNEATSSFTAADASMTSGNYTKAAGDVSGRKVTVSPPNASATSTADVDHIAIVDTVNSILLFVTATDTVSLISGEEVEIAAFDIEVEDPQAP